MIKQATLPQNTANQDSSDTRKNRVKSLRTLMASMGVQALIIPSNDPHMSEYLPRHWQGREWVSGFSGSLGTLVITEDFAGVWTDSRYWVQAPIELIGTDICLMKMESGTPSYESFLATRLKPKDTVAIDGMVLSVAEFHSLRQKFDTNGIILKTDIDILDKVWTSDTINPRPSLPCAPIVIHDDEFVSENTCDKLARIAQEMRKKNANAHLISSLDDIAWITNLRGADVLFNPVFLSHLLITQDEQGVQATLYVDSAKLSAAATQKLVCANINIDEYCNINKALSDISGVLMIDPQKAAIGLIKNVTDSVQIIHAFNPSSVFKAVKSPKDIANIKNAMRQDGVALCEFFYEFETRLNNGERLSELDVGDMLYKARSRQPYFVSESFDTIAGFGANGAIVHYHATPERFGYLDTDGLLLIDSGAQYQNGTTDITRMAGVGSVSDTQKTDVTYVLKAHIALARAVFPVNIPSMQLDVLARNELWRYGLDYGHGTGHGVGYFLNVHEGPQAISRNAPVTSERVMKMGMVTSNEPGLYREGQWGIRLENLVVNVHAHSSEYGEFLKFENLTLCPFDTRLILPDLLTDCEKEWVNNYHKQVCDELEGFLDGGARQWLIDRCQKI